MSRGELLDRCLRYLGYLVAAGLGAAFALYDVGFVVLHFHSIRVPLTVLLALIGNPLLALFAYVVTRHKAAGIVPALTWCGVWFTAASKSSDGDWLVLPNNWVGIVTSLVGPIAFAVMVYEIVTWPRRELGVVADDKPLGANLNAEAPLGGKPRQGAAEPGGKPQRVAAESEAKPQRGAAPGGKSQRGAAQRGKSRRG